MDDGSGYELDDPKHPTYRERMVGLWDDRDKTQPFRTVRRSQITACPARILTADHYRDDGTCKCDERRET